MSRNPPPVPAARKWPDGTYHRRKYSIKDIILITICVSGAAVSLYLFRLDLFNSIASQNSEAAGTITIKHNNVQRRLFNRVLWSRLLVESPVYRGDLIRVAEQSEAALHIRDSDIDISENTLIRIQNNLDQDGNIIIDLDSGSLNLFSGSDSGLALNIRGSRVSVGSDTVLQASAGEDGLVLSVNSGSASVISGDSQSRSIEQGELLAIDPGGAERLIPAIVMTEPRPNARFLADESAPLYVDFSWKRINLAQGEPVLFETARDSGYSSIEHRTEALDKAALNLDAGQWYWRILYKNEAIASGRINILNAAAPSLVSPVQDSLFRYADISPKVRFEWTQVEGASSYIFEAGRQDDLSSPLITRSTQAASLVEMDLNEGTWYWRVKPVFPSLVEGSALYTPAASFSIEQSRDTDVLVLPESDRILFSKLSGESVPVSETVSESELFSKPAGESVSASGPDNESESFSKSESEPVPVREAGSKTETVPELPGGSVPEPESESDKFVKTPQSQLPSPAVSQPVPPPPTKPPPSAPAAKPPAPAAKPPAPAAKPPAPEPKPPGPFPAPANRLPASGYRVNFDELREDRQIKFSWTAVNGANAYILTLYQEESGVRRQIIRTNPVQRTEYSLNDLSLLDRGVFYWQVEAVSIKSDGTIDRRGTIGENRLVIDISLPAPLQLDDIGVLYGN